MKKIKHHKDCNSVVCYKFSYRNLICCGVAKKGSRFPKDIIWLCLKGELGQNKMEMTPREASLIVSALSCAIAQTMPPILKKQKTKRRKKK